MPARRIGKRYLVISATVHSHISKSPIVSSERPFSGRLSEREMSEIDFEEDTNREHAMVANKVVIAQLCLYRPKPTNASLRAL